MSIFKVEYDTLGVTVDGKVGNVSQGKNTAYTAADFSQLQRVINEELAPKKKVCHILKVERLAGHIVEGS